MKLGGSAECIFPDEIVGEKFLRQHIANLEARVKELSSALKESDPDHPALKVSKSEEKSEVQLYSAKNAEFLSEQDLVDGLGFLSLTSGAEPLYVGGSSGASWGRIFSSFEFFYSFRVATALRRIPHFFAGSLIPPKASPRRLSVDAAVGNHGTLSHDSTAPHDADSGIFQTQFSMQLEPGFIFPPLPQDERLCDEIFATVFTTVQARHCFMNFVILKKWYDHRHIYCASERPLSGNGPRTAAFFLWKNHSWLAITRSMITFDSIPDKDARNIKWAKETDGILLCFIFIFNLFTLKYYFQAALQYYDHVSSNTTTIQALLFLAMYSFRSTRGLSTWHLTGLAMRTALELGLHRKTPKAQQLSPFHEETKKRIWWSVYALESPTLHHTSSEDRAMAFQLGRPIAIQDDEIDNEKLPLDIDCHITDDEQILARRVAIDTRLSETATTLENDPYMLPTSSMAPSLHHIRLRKILTKIKGQVYHPRFSHENIGKRCANIDALALELDRWRAKIPTKTFLNKDVVNVFGLKLATQTVSQSGTESCWDLGGSPFHTCEWFELQLVSFLYSHSSLKFDNYDQPFLNLTPIFAFSQVSQLQSLLIPIALTAPPGSPYLQRAAHAAMAACELQKKRLDKNSMAPLAVYSLHKLFMSGVFMLFALDRDPNLSVAPEDVGRSYSAENSGLQDPNISFARHSASHDGISPRVLLQVKNCQEALEIYALHYSQAKPYAQCFEKMTAIWLRRFDSRDNRRDFSAKWNLSPERKSENDPGRNAEFTHQSSDDCFKPTLVPTLWKDDLNLPGRMRPRIEESASLDCDPNLLRPGAPRYHLLSLGPVEPHCEPFQLLKSEEERYQSQKPWMLGRIERACPNDFLNNISPTLGPNVSNLPSSYPSKVDNPDSIISDSGVSFLPSSLFGSENHQTTPSCLDNQAKRSDYSSWNDISIDQNTNKSANSNREIRNNDTATHYGEYPTSFLEATEEKFRKQSFISQNSFYEEGNTSTGEASLSRIVKNQHSHPPELSGNPRLITEDNPGVRYPWDQNDKSHMNKCSSTNAWSGEASEFPRGENYIASMGGAQAPGLNLCDGQPMDAPMNDTNISSSTLFLTDDSLANTGLDLANTVSGLESNDPQGLQKCLEIFLSGTGDYSNPFGELLENLISSDTGNSDAMKQPDGHAFCEGMATNSHLVPQGSAEIYTHK
ncbi:hypothetical protein VP01_1792g8 [Puccinia sorghi]|uniref:Xylanolytic transcriptional activator regulatory domain-containing protein n=1 Tax=Puccinia sorghi TaxID=27349 RepID=A0A0L6VEK9_9BASI|nr:hypothetical protein VP01_1792g8 [Puccinia sorghi]